MIRITWTKFHFIKTECFLFIRCNLNVCVINYFNMTTVQITKTLSDIYPQIQQQLCTKHSTTLNKINNQFKALYSNQSPTHFIVVKGVAKIVSFNNTNISMALQSAVIIALRPNPFSSEIYVNTNKNNQEIILQPSGKIKQNPQHQYGLHISRAWQSSVDDLSLTKLKGGLLYVFSNLPNNKFDEENAILIGTLLSGLVINETISQYNTPELISKIESCQIGKNNKNIQLYFSSYAHNQIYASINGKTLQPNFQNKNKFIIASLKFLDCKFQQQKLVNEELINSYLTDIAKLQIEKLLQQIWKRQAKLISNDLKQKIESLFANLKIKSWILMEENYCLFVVQGFRSAQIVGYLSRLIRKSIETKTEKILTNRFESAINMGELIFSSVPSVAVSILDPSQSIWFN